MNPFQSSSDELRFLIARLSEGMLTAEEAARLNELLRADPMAQEAYLDQLAMDALLECEFGGAAMRPVHTSTKVRIHPAVSEWRRRFGGFGQMAAGLVLGAFLASAVWAYALPYMNAVGSKLLPLADAGFEASASPAPDGVPSRPGVWSGDYVKLTGPAESVAPYSGSQMLRFLRAGNAHTRPSTPVRAAELWQVLDLRPLRATIGSGTVTLQLGAWFNSAPDLVGRYSCGVALVASRGEASDAPAVWSRRHDVALAESDTEEWLDGDSATWQRIETQVAVPPEAELLLVQVRIYDKSATVSEGGSVFPAHFADDVSLRVLPSENLVVRQSLPR